jgi:peptidyl-prolyl cis-trans isomerase D
LDFLIIKITDKQDESFVTVAQKKVEAPEATSDKIFTQTTKFEMESADKILQSES